MTHTDAASPRRAIGVAVDPQTYRNLVYLALAWPLGLLYFVVLVAGIATGVGTIPVLVGIPILAGVLVLSVHLAALEGRLASGLLGVDADFEAARPRDETIVPYLARLVRDPQSYLAVGYLLSKFAIGTAAFVLLVTAASLSAAFAAAPLVYDHPGVAYRFGAWHVATLPEALLVGAAGIVVAFASLHVVNVAAWLVGEYTEVMLGSPAGDGESVDRESVDAVGETDED